jgi:transposase
MELTMEDKKRIEIVQAVLARKITVEDAAKILARSERQIFRLKRRLLEAGLSGMIHGNRGRRSPRRLPDAIQKKILDLVQRGPYHDINDTHLSELLASREGICLSRERLRRLLRGADIKAKRPKRHPKYRSRRPRKKAFGMMLQIDGSPHDWLEGRGPELTLIGARDDATNHGWALFVPRETTWAYLDLMRDIFTEHGLPLALYSDRHSIFHVDREPTLQEQLKDQQPLTQFGRAMKELGVTIIPASSPQAKGRIERFWGFSQDRLVVELRLDGACTIEQANQTLVRFLRNTVNAHFKVAPANSQSVFRKAPKAELLDRILCLKDIRTVAKDHTISFEGLTLQIPPLKSYRSIAGKKVEVLQLKNGSIQIQYRQMLVTSFSPQAINRLYKTKLLGPSNLKAVA